MKILLHLYIFTFLFSENNINLDKFTIDDYLIEDKYDNKRLTYKSQVSFNYQEEIHVSKNCREHIRYIPNQISGKTFYTTYTYKICKEGNQLVRYESDENNESYVILDTSKEWIQKVGALTVVGNQRIPIKYRCKIRNVFQEKLFKELHKILYVECKYKNRIAKSYLFASKLGKIKEFYGKDIELYSLVKLED